MLRSIFSILRLRQVYIVRTAILTILACSAPSCARSEDTFRGLTEAKQVTRELPSIDKIELFELERVGDLWTGEIRASKTIEGSEAQQIASLWRSQVYLADPAICHNPAYAIKFLSRQKLIAYASLCWDCDNIEFLEPRLSRYQGFAGKHESGQRLLGVFTSAFPEPKQSSN